MTPDNKSHIFFLFFKELSETQQHNFFINAGLIESDEFLPYSTRRQLLEYFVINGKINEIEEYVTRIIYDDVFNSGESDLEYFLRRKKELGYE
jgi:hypothetical protein